MLPGGLAGRGKRGSKPASGRRRRWKLDHPGSADCLIYFKIKQMAATGVCLSSAQSWARGQEPQGSCAKNFSMTLVVKPPLPLLFELEPHHTHVGLLAPSLPESMGCHFVCLTAESLSLSLSLSPCSVSQKHVSLCVCLSLSLSLSLSPFSGNLPPKLSPGSPAPCLCPHSSPMAPTLAQQGTWRTAKPLWPLCVLWAVPS